MGVLKYIKQALRDIKEEINSNAIIVGDFNTLLTSVDRLSRQKVNKKTGFEWYLRPDGPNRYIQYISSETVEYTFKYTGNILQNRSC